MRRTTRQVIAVVVVATALCADRAAHAAGPRDARPASQPGLARSLAQKIARSFSRSVSSVRVQPVRTAESSSAFPLVIREEASGVRTPLSPFQFRLPPPDC